jgi:hypothetical protein
MRAALGFLKDFAWPFGLCAGLFALFSRFIPIDMNINLLASLAINVVLIAIILTICFLILDRDVFSQHPTFKIAFISDAGRLFLIEKTDQLGVNMGANIYFKEEVYERQIATGIVSHVQSDGKIQLSVRYLPAAETDLVSKISQNFSTVRKQIVIRPGVLIQIEDSSQDV